MKDKLSGRFVVVDGPDGCGKSTQAELLVKWLNGRGVPARKFRDPGDTPIGEKIRDVLLSTEHISMAMRTELLLYMAARAQLWSEKIKPALQENNCVVLDRWLSSTFAYQGFAGDFGVDKVIRIATDCLERVWPDLIIILDVDLKTSSGRLNRELDRMEAKGDEYHEKVREGFLSLARDYEVCRLVDASGDIQMVHEQILQIVSEESF